MHIDISVDRISAVCILTPIIFVLASTSTYGIVFAVNQIYDAALQCP